LLLFVHWYLPILSVHFTSVTLPATLSDYSYMAASWSGSTVVAAGQFNGAGVLIKSSDGGITWSRVLNTSALLYNVAIKTLGSTTYSIAVDSTRRPYISSDLQVWTSSATIGSTGSAIGIAIGSNGNAFVVGTSSFVYKSSNSSSYSTWTQVTTGAPTTQWQDVQTNDGVNVIIVGSGGRIYYSSNAGSSWIAGSSGISTTIFALALAPENSAVAFAAGNSGYLAKSTNSGATWTAITNAYNSSFTSQYHSISALSTTEVYVCAFISSQPSRVYQSVDGGSTWTIMTTVNTVLYSISMRTSSYGIVGASSGFGIMAVVAGEYCRICIYITSLCAHYQYHRPNWTTIFAANRSTFISTISAPNSATLLVANNTTQFSTNVSSFFSAFKSTDTSAVCSTNTATPVDAVHSTIFTTYCHPIFSAKCATNVSVFCAAK